MREELYNQQVLAMYDVRGIQNYIFKSNAAKEIIGASVLVEAIITDGLNAYIKNNAKNQEQYLTDWKNDDPKVFLENPEIEMQVMFVGGGNAYVLFRRGEECRNVNRFLAKYVLERTYSLNLAVAVVKKTNAYDHDYAEINEEMRRIKAFMPSTQPTGALPFMEADSITGYPLTRFEEKTKTYYCTEAYLKRKSFPRNENEKIFDNMVTEKGDNSTLAVCHIDGNSMGIRIRNEMQNVTAYEEAIPKMRGLSQKISAVFGNTFINMTKYMDELTPKVKENIKTRLYRKIVVAGDDITFVCNAKLAIPAVRYFLEHLGGEGEDDVIYSACGGIAYFNSHFPFSDAYQVAEACCDTAKSRAKKEENRGKSGFVGNFFDYQICTNIRAADLEEYRDRHYSSDQGTIIARPYFVSGVEDEEEFKNKNGKYSIEKLIYWSKYFTMYMPRNKAKHLRNVIPMGTNELEKEISFLESRGYTELTDHSGMKEAATLNDDEYRIWYDALEIMDLYVEESSHEDNN